MILLWNIEYPVVWEPFPGEFLIISHFLLNFLQNFWLI